MELYEGVSLERLQALAKVLASRLPSCRVIYLHGPLGAGKTTLVRFLLAALGHDGIVKSPTYSIIEHYELPDITVHHLDCYRLSSGEELEMIGIRDFMQAGHCCLVEWPDCGFSEVLTGPPDVEIRLAFEGGEDSRRVEIISSEDA